MKKLIAGMVMVMFLMGCQGATGKIMEEFKNMQEKITKLEEKVNELEGKMNELSSKIEELTAKKEEKKSTAPVTQPAPAPKKPPVRKK